MKTRLLSIILAFAGLLLTSCSDETETSDGGGSDGRLLSISEVYNDSIHLFSRATGTEEKNSWSSGDAIGVSAYTSMDGSAKMKDGSLNMKWTYSSGSWSCTSPLNIFNYDSEGYLTAYYPYSSSITDPTAIPITASADWMYAPITDNRTVSYSYPKNSLTMKHVCAQIIVNLVRDDYAGTGEVTSMTVGSSKFASAATLNSLTGDLSSYTSNGTITSTFTGNLPMDKSNATTIEEWFIPIDDAVSDLVFEATIDGRKERYTISQKFDKGKRYMFTLSISNSGMDMRAENSPVDLGLPSGLKWAAGNLGAYNPQDNGLYYAWGETTGYAKGSGHDFSSSTYSAGSAASISADLTSTNDAATVRLGSQWRMPTSDEFNELMRGCYIEYTKNYNSTGIMGYIVYKTKYDADKGLIHTSSSWKYMSSTATSYSSTTTTATTGSYSLSDAHIFIPAAGRYNGVSMYGETSYGYYWSSTFRDSSEESNLFFYSSYCGNSSNYRYNGFSVRAVCE